jgi:ribokinase
MPKISVLGSIHMDFTITLPNLPRYGETVIGYELKMTPGGKGANQAVASAKLGMKTYMIGKVGYDFMGEILIKNLEKNNVEKRYVYMDKDSHTGIALILVDSKGRNMIAVAPGADSKVSKKDVDDAVDAIKSSDILLTQLEIPISTVEYAVKKAKDVGTKVIVNPAPAASLPKSLIENTDILTPNEVELETLTGIKINEFNLSEVKKAAKRLIDIGVKTVIVTLGERGALLVNNKGSKHVKGVKVNVVDTTGAGDAFNAALAVALAEGKDVEQAVRIANYVGALATIKVGAQEALPTREELNKFVKNYI